MATTTFPGQHTSLLTADDLETLPDDLGRSDLIRGELIQMAPAAAKHGKYAMRFGSRLDVYVTEHKLGTVFAAETGFVLARDPDTVLAPDIAFVRADRLPSEDEWDGYLAIAPDLVVEVLSPSDTARSVLDKVLFYLDAGTRLVVTLDPTRQITIVYGPDRVGRILRRDETFDGGDVVPGFRLPLADLFT
jgi:Uma2 family endonuclease